MSNPIYFDHAATTPVAPEVLEAMLPYFSEKFGNAATLYESGTEAREALETARAALAALLGCRPEEVYFTSGGSESDNMALIGTLLENSEKGNHIVTTTIEHHAVLETAEFLADHIAVIHKGKIIAEGSLEDLIQRYGKSSILHIKKCKDAPDVVAMLKREGFPDATSTGNGDIAVKIDYKERVLEILSHLRHDCIEYDSVSIRGSNLEEVFLRLTGSKLTEEEK
jgi:hypothetical protein